MTPEEVEKWREFLNNTEKLFDRINFELDFVTSNDLKNCRSQFILEKSKRHGTDSPLPVFAYFAGSIIGENKPTNPLERRHECDHRCGEHYPVSYFDDYYTRPIVTPATEKDFGIDSRLKTKPQFEKKRQRKQNKKQTSWR